MSTKEVSVKLLDLLRSQLHLHKVGQHAYGSRYFSPVYIFSRKEFCEAGMKALEGGNKVER